MKKLTPEQQKKAIELLKESLDAIGMANYDLNDDFVELEDEINNSSTKSNSSPIKNTTG